MARDGTEHHAQLLVAIGRALGGQAPYPEIIGIRENAINLPTLTSAPISLSCEVLGGAFDGRGRVAWVEQRSDTPTDGHVPVEIDLRIAWDGVLRSVTTVDTYNPYFGCRVMLARWYGDDFVFIYREKHKMIAARVAPPYDVHETAVLSDELIEDRDIVYFLSDGKVHGRSLPLLEPIVPVPAPAPDRWAIQELWLEAPGVARLATWPENEDITWEERRRIGRAAAQSIALVRERDDRDDPRGPPE